MLMVILLVMRLDFIVMVYFFLVWMSLFGVKMNLVLCGNVWNIKVGNDW